MVSPGATVIALPPSHVQLPLAADFGAFTEPVTSRAPAVLERAAFACVGLGLYEAMPCPPPAVPELPPAAAAWGAPVGEDSGWLSTDAAGVGCAGGIDPVASGPLR